MPTMPNFFIVGAQRAGTTNLYHLLQQHPQIFMSAMKEPGYFHWVDHPDGVRWPNGAVTRPGIHDEDEYLRLFSRVTNEKTIGEASSIYLDSPNAAYRIRGALPHAKILVLLRNPVDRAYSAYNLLRRNGREPLEDFDEALRMEPARIAGNFSQNFFYVRRGLYPRHLTAWYSTFPPDQIRVHLFDDLVADPVKVCKDIYRYLEVDGDFCPDIRKQDSIKRNESGVPDSGVIARVRRLLLNPVGAPRLKSMVPTALRLRLHDGARRMIGTMGLRKPREIPADCRARLNAIYREDIQSLQDLLGRDLSQWMR